MESELVDPHEDGNVDALIVVREQLWWTLKPYRWQMTQSIRWHEER